SSEFSNGVYNTLQPIHVCNVWNIDTGAGWSGKLTIMDVDTKEYWQSDLSPDLSVRDASNIPTIRYFINSSLAALNSPSNSKKSL
ncbi:MAG: hypothetical protein FJZ13_04585, partial [Candidatus Omnitrophica bacterium]|nr:hypothetical protein [Candidatus Omnitrophota bacterium]